MKFSSVKPDNNTTAAGVEPIVVAKIDSKLPCRGALKAYCHVAIANMKLSYFDALSAKIPCNRRRSTQSHA